MSHQNRRNKAIRNNVQRTPIVLLILGILAVVAGDIFLDFGLNGFDYAALVILGFFALKGYLQGIINTVFSVVGYVVGAVSAILLSSPAAAWVLEHTDFAEGLAKRLNKMVPLLSQIPVATPDTTSGITNAVGWLQTNPTAAKALESQPLLQQTFETANPVLTNIEGFTTTTMTLNDWLVYSLLRILGMFILFMLIKFLFVIIGHFITSMMNLSTVMGTANRMAGMGLGLLAGIVILYVLYGTVIPFIGGLHLIKIPESFSEAKTLIVFHKLLDVIAEWRT